MIDEIKKRLAALEPDSLDIHDDSALHAGHKGNGGGGHYTVKIVSSHFYEKSQIMRHRMVYSALQDLMPHKIHALSIEAIAKNEIKTANTLT